MTIRGASLALAILLAACGGGDGGDSLLDGQIEFTGPPPPLVSLTYTTPEGATLTAAPVFEGWIQVLAAPDQLDAVQAAAAARGATVIDAIPAVGLYLLETAPADVPAAIVSLAAEPFVELTGPVGITVPSGLAVIDVEWGMSIDEGCGGQHGDCVAAVAARSGGTVEQVDSLQLAPFREFLNSPFRSVFTHSIVRNMITAAERAHARGERVVVNISLGPCEEGVPGYEPAACKRAELERWLAMAKLLAAASPAVRDNVIVVLSAGNSGLDLTAELAALRAAQPAGFARMRIVGAGEDAGVAEPRFNHAAADMVLAPAVNVLTLDGIREDGTSFAAPEVARVLDEAWRQVPALTSTELLGAFDLALGPTRVLPATSATGRSDEFAARFLAEARAVASRVPLVVCEWVEQLTVTESTRCSYDAMAGCDLAGGAPITLRRDDQGRTVLTLRRPALYKAVRVIQLDDVTYLPVYGVESTSPLPAEVVYGDYTIGTPSEGFHQPSPALVTGKKYSVSFENTDADRFASMSVQVLLGADLAPGDCGP